MSNERVKPLTQDELLAELHKLGLNDITKRQIADWRRKDLLPPFDVIGSGRGRQRGRECSSWINGDSVLNQALWVRYLLQLYGSIESIRFPLWVLGYPIPLQYVREVLGVPLNEINDAIASSIANENRACGEVEDIIEEACFHIFNEIKHEMAEGLLMPQHSLEAFLNVLFNRDYDLTDGGFELGAEEFENYESIMLRRHADALAAEGLGDIDLTTQDSQLKGFFERAPFIKKYFSLHQLQLAVAECTDADLHAVQYDLYLLREMAILVHKIITTLMRELPEEQKPTLADILRPAFTLSQLVTLADLSLRRHGFAYVIDYLLPKGLHEFQQAFTDDLELELIEASKMMPQVMETYSTIMVNCFTGAVQTQRQ